MYQNKTQDVQFRYETKSDRVRKYIDIDSTYRNRLDNPLQSSFIINFNKSGRITNLGNSSDPVSLSSVLATGTASSGPNNSIVVLQTGSILNNFYINDYIGVNFPGQITNQYRKVIG